MPLYDYICDTCGKYTEVILPIQHNTPTCCDSSMRRVYKPFCRLATEGILFYGKNYPRWVDRMEDIHKAQEQRGERLRFVHPSEVL